MWLEPFNWQKLFSLSTIPESAYMIVLFIFQLLVPKLEIVDMEF
jgi:hypothetical protein